MDRVARIIPKKKMLFFMVAASAVTFSFSSCKLGEKYARPELNLPTELEAGADSLSVVIFPGKACMPIPLCNGLLRLPWRIIKI